MKKLTAGIFTVMLGLVAVDANAAITSQKYVDDALATKAGVTELNAVKLTADGAVQTTDFNAFKTTNTDAIADAKKAGTDAAAALDTYKGEVTTALGTKQNTLQAASISGNDAAGNVITGISANNGVITVTKATVATAEGLEDLEGRVDTAESDITTLKTGVATNTDKIATLNGDATTEGSVAKAIADEVTRADNAYDAKGTAAAAETAAKAYADGLAGNYATAAQGAKADTAVQPDALTTELAKKQDKLTAGTNISIDAATNTISATGLASATDLTSLTTRVDTAEDEIDALQGTVGNAESGLVKSVADNAAAIATNAAEIAKKANTTDLKRLATAEVPAGCETGECVLKYKGGVYSWEPIELTYTAGTAE